jgi:hypothetical protein
MMLSCGGQTFALLPNDIAAIPAWTWPGWACTRLGSDTTFR